jgi:purine-nucleoside phosphorylase
MGFGSPFEVGVLYGIYGVDTIDIRAGACGANAAAIHLAKVLREAGSSVGRPRE